MSNAVHPVKHPANIKRETEMIKSHQIINFLRKCSGETTIHGIRNLFEADSFVVRRILWLFVILVCTGFCIQQFYMRITKYISDPETVDLDIVYINQHDFPQVTICNNNIFKSTTLGSPAGYDAAIQFSSSKDFSDQNFIQRLESFDQGIFATTGSYINLTQQYIDSRHEIKDMLIECFFRGKPCNHENFVMIFTDTGVCYQFIGDGSALTVSSAGVGNGLSLKLNVEQYAYTMGPRYSAGILALIQHSGEIPIIEGKAFVVPVGGEVFLGLDLTKIDLLPPPSGQCSNKVLKYFSPYSVSACQLECLTDYVVSNCGCRNGYMPGNTSICRIVKYFRCSYPFSKNYSQSSFSQSCYCPPTCTDRAYTLTMTTAPTSDFNADVTAQSLAGDKNLFLDYVISRGIFDFHYNIPQTNQDLAALYRFAPFLADITSASAALYPVLQSISELLAAFVKTITRQSSVDFNVSKTTAQSTINIVENVTQVIQSVDPSAFNGKAFYSVTDLQSIFQDSLGVGNRIMLFDSFRNDTDESNNVTVFTFLKQNFHESIQSVAQGSQLVIRLIANRDLAVSFPDLNPIIQNISDSMSLLTAASAIYEIALHNMTDVGLPLIHEYASHNVPKTSSIRFDADFVRSNFMKVEIFFKEMRYQQINKQLADSTVGLVCDLGGTFGLCLGASIMSVYELLDFFIGYVKIKMSKPSQSE